MALYIPHSIFHLARLLCVRPETFGSYYVHIPRIRLHISKGAVTNSNLNLYSFHATVCDTTNSLKVDVMVK